ncbi:Flavodoxin [Cupriavidus sp. YR651]|uniref:flavodoxin family protein n=1 Tax=Cupriavidus sp. YR651 TaxID=1855315 RepID=UPI0008861C78|nr:flavodoxin family protein [Cupriavidus sp. YR651]SDD82299.1 Flavodoxin [Cupriavidus sp. YR651]
MPDNVIVYYSRTGTTRQVAEDLASRTGWPLAEIQDVRSRAGLSGDLRCVLDNLFRRRPAYRYNGQSLATCKSVVVLAPVWVGHVAAPLRSFLHDQAPFQGRLAAVCVMAARGGFNAAEEIAQASGKLPQPTLVVLQRDVASGAAAQELSGFVENLLHGAAEEGGAPRRAWLSPNEA